MITALRERLVGTYPWYSGWIIATILATTVVVRLRLGAFGWMFTWQMVAVALLTALLGLLTLHARSASTPRMRNLRDLGFAAYALTGITILFLDHRYYLLVVALTQAAMVTALLRSTSPRERIILGTVAVVSWVLSAGLVYTQLYDWMLNTTASALAIPAFLFALALSCVEFTRDRATEAPPLRAAFFAASILIFALLALRVDHLTADWVPYHRSYFADVAQFVKDGHWLLRDVPSLYGFLSELTIAVTPAENAWQGLYELTALFLVGVATMIYVVLRARRGGPTNALFALLFSAGAVFGENIARYDWGGRLYPQGGLRFFWLQALIFIVFLRYRSIESKRSRMCLLAAGYLIWIVSMLWSVEAGAWATAVWIPYLIADVYAGANVGQTAWVTIRALMLRALPLVALAATALASLQIIYVQRWGSGPDWRGFVEFASFFAAGKIRLIFSVQPFGAGWILVLVICALGTLALIALALKSRNLFSLLLASWLAMWSAASYFAVEPLDEYLALLLPTLALGIGIAIFASRELDLRGIVANARVARLSLLPIVVIVIAYALGEPGRWAQARTPLTPGWNFDSLQSMTPITGELRGLMKQAGVKRMDLVLFPNGDYWTEPTQGIVLPFGQDDDGSIFLYRSWLPISPVGPQMLSELLTVNRRQHFIDAFLASGKTGWYISYRSPAECHSLSPRLHSTNKRRSANFSIAYCQLAKTTVAKGKE